MKNRPSRSSRSVPIRLPHDAPMDYAPDNEQGVVFLFAELARRRWGMRVESIQTGYPDCVAYRRGRRQRIEFEFKSSNFKAHGHDPKRCDMVVCWIDDWNRAPPGLDIVELRREFGMGFNVWIQPVRNEYREAISAVNRNSNWSVARQAKKGDLVLFYRASPDSYLSDVFVLTNNASHVAAGWRNGGDWMASIRRVAQLRTPLHLDEMRQHRVLKTTSFVRKNMQGRNSATDHWPLLHDLIVRRNPKVEKVLRPFGPERVSRG